MQTCVIFKFLKQMNRGGYVLQKGHTDSLKLLPDHKELVQSFAVNVLSVYLRVQRADCSTLIFLHVCFLEVHYQLLSPS